VSGLKAGDLVITPFTWADITSASKWCGGVVGLRHER
jgi:hypothetical protein